MNEPLAAQLRPISLEDFIGQEHLLGEGKPLCVAMEKKQKLSFVLWGPPGVGKTTIARLYANSLELPIKEISAVSAGKDEMRKAVQDKGSILFVDEIHRFNKAQQDFLLPYIEDGTIIFIGATTENPSFEIIAPLLSRCRVFVLKELTLEDLAKIGKRIEKKLKIILSPEVIDCVGGFSGGDARQFIGLIETTFNLYKNITIENLKNALQSKTLRYDKFGDEHYNTISAFIKSMRASNPDAAIYYLARMIEAGEDPLFIARRMVIFASEDIGNAIPTALVVANNVFEACQKIGYPECAINLAQGVAYLANCKKDRSAYDALRAAQADIKRLGSLPIPLKLRNAPTKLMADLDYGKNYQMYGDSDLLPEELKNKKYFK